jgi:hypothetical protein
MNNTLTAEILHTTALKNAKAEIAALFAANPVFVVNILGLDTEAKREAWAVESVLDGSVA